MDRDNKYTVIFSRIFPDKTPRIWEKLEMGFKPPKLEIYKSQEKIWFWVLKNLGHC